MFQKSPYFVLSSDSEASLTSFGMTHRDVLPKRISAEEPLALLGATKKMARGDKKGLGTTKSSLRTTAYPFLPEARQCQAISLAPTFFLKFN
jgi:hypothetical protein